MHSLADFLAHPVVAFIGGVVRELLMGFIGGLVVARIILRREWEAAKSNQQTADALSRTADMLLRMANVTARGD